MQSAAGSAGSRRLQSPERAERIQIPNSYKHSMHVTDKGQVTIPKHIRIAAGVAPGSEVSFSMEGSKIVITPVGSGVKDDRRVELRAAAARVKSSMAPEFRQLDAGEIMAFLRGVDAAPTAAPTAAPRGRR